MPSRRGPNHRAHIGTACMARGRLRRFQREESSAAKARIVEGPPAWFARWVINFGARILGTLVGLLPTHYYYYYGGERSLAGRALFVRSVSEVFIRSPSFA